jgi:hypothetical protein
MPWVYDDGGRAAAGYKGTAGDCVVRAVSIAASDGAEYATTYQLLKEANERHAAKRRDYVARRIQKTGVTPRNGNFRKVYGPVLENQFGWRWVPTMSIGSGTTVHLTPGELPDEGRLVVMVSRHACAVIDGVIHDISDPSRDGTRAVYGYYIAS